MKGCHQPIRNHDSLVAHDEIGWPFVVQKSGNRHIGVSLERFAPEQLEQVLRISVVGVVLHQQTDAQSDDDDYDDDDVLDQFAVHFCSLTFSCG